MIKAVLFDFWGTLAFNDGNKKEWDKILDIVGDNKSKFKKLMFGWWFTHNVDEKTFFTKVCNELGLNKSYIEKLANIWEEQYETATLYKNTIDVLLELKDKGYKVGLVTNTAPYTKKTLKDLKIDNIFDLKVFSCDVGYVKPSKEIYEVALKKIKLKPEEVLFIGNDERNDVGGPRKLGMRSFLINRKYHGEDNIQSLNGVFDIIFAYNSK